MTVVTKSVSANDSGTRKRSPVTGTLIVALIGSSGIGIAIHTGRANAEQERRTRNEMSELRETLARVEARPPERTLIERVREVSAAPAAEATRAEGNAVAGQDDQSEELSPEEKQRQTEARSQRHIETYAAVLAAEPRDVAWDRDVSQLLSDKYLKSDIAGIQFSSACASSLCKIEYSYAQAGDARAVLNFVGTLPWNGQQHCRLDAMHQKGFCYAAREGMHLPTVE
jgi:hypothetical protein